MLRLKQKRAGGAFELKRFRAKVPEPKHAIVSRLLFILHVYISKILLCPKTSVALVTYVSLSRPAEVGSYDWPSYFRSTITVYTRSGGDDEEKCNLKFSIMIMIMIMIPLSWWRLWLRWWWQVWWFYKIVHIFDNYDDGDGYDGDDGSPAYSNHDKIPLRWNMVGLCHRHIKSFLFCGVMYIFTQLCLL